VKDFDSPGEGGKGTIGWKVRRKEESQLRCLTVKDIFEVWDDSIEKTIKGHRRPIFRQAENATTLGVEWQEGAQEVRSRRHIRIVSHFRVGQIHMLAAAARDIRGMLERGDETRFHGRSGDLYS
jgi:hypothetical protein